MTAPNVQCLIIQCPSPPPSVPGLLSPSHRKNGGVPARGAWHGPWTTAQQNEGGREPPRRPPGGDDEPGQRTREVAGGGAVHPPGRGVDGVTGVPRAGGRWRDGRRVRRLHRERDAGAPALAATRGVPVCRGPAGRDPSPAR